LDEAKTDVVACMTFPTEHRIKPHPTNAGRPIIILFEQDRADVRRRRPARRTA